MVNNNCEEITSEEYRERLQKISFRKIDYEVMDKKIIQINKEIEDFEKNKKIFQNISEETLNTRFTV